MIRDAEAMKLSQHKNEHQNSAKVKTLAQHTNLILAEHFPCSHELHELVLTFIRLLDVASCMQKKE